MKKDNVGFGFMIVFGLNLLQLGLTFVLANAPSRSGYNGLGVLLIGLGGFSIVQLVYVVPFYFYFRSSQRRGTAKGIVIAACVTVLLNCICWGVISR